MMMRRYWRSAACAAWIMCFWSGVVDAATWRIEAEQAGDGNIEKVLSINPVAATWQVEKVMGASAGAVLGGTAKGESHPIATRIPRAGAYHLWIRHAKTVGKPTSFFVLFRDAVGESVGLRMVDFRPRLQTAHPLEPLPEADKKASSSLVWSSAEITFERSMDATLSFGFANGVADGKVGIDCVIVSNDPSFDPEKTDWSKLPTEPGECEPQPAPKGLKPTLPLTYHSSFFAGNPEPERQLGLSLQNGSIVYRDYPWILQLGANRDAGWHNGSVKHGIGTEANPGLGYMTQDLEKQTPPPVGRFVNAEGKVGKGFSLSYEPYRKAYIEKMACNFAAFKDMEDVERFMTASEFGGVFDYSDASRDRFHQWLERRYGDVGKLNELWRTQHKDFASIPLPQTPKENEIKAPWFAFREFCGLELVSFIAEKNNVIEKLDPKRRPCTSRASCVIIQAPNFTSTAPLDCEDLINVGYANQPTFGWDSYSTEDTLVGCDADLLLSLLNGKNLVNSEFNTHGQDPRIMARTYWCMIAKGLKGVHIHTFQQALNHWDYCMWGMLNPDFTPRDKLGAVADANHEAHRLERLLAAAKPTPFVKPVALYYSRMDLSLPQPTFGQYSAAIDSPYRIYSVLRGLGYSTRWITPRQIDAGCLKDVGAVVMVGVKYVPGQAAAKLAQWVKDGGCLIGDQWPGAFDEYDRPQGTLSEAFGIRAEKAKAAVEDAKLKFEETTTPVFSVDPEVLRSLNANEILKRVEEMWEQWDAKHPVARTVGNWHLSGFDLKNIEVVSGEIIGMTMGSGAAGRGRPAMVLNDYGKGHTLYSAIMLGTLRESGPIYHEWDSLREGPGLHRILDAFLRFSGVEPFATSGLPERVGWNTRIETPLVDEKGNAMVGMINVNSGSLPAFPLSLRWPDSAAKPKLVLACFGGSRLMTSLPFEQKGGKLSMLMPGFDTHAALLALTDSDPLISLAISGAPREKAGLLEVTPETRLKIKATIWNPSPRKMAAGVARLHAAAGWFCDENETRVGAIDAYGSAEVEFTVTAPAICSQRTLRPIVFKYESVKTTSTPATEMVWWTPASRPEGAP